MSEFIAIQHQCGELRLVKGSITACSIHVYVKCYCTEAIEAVMFKPEHAVETKTVFFCDYISNKMIITWFYSMMSHLNSLEYINTAIFTARQTLAMHKIPLLESGEKNTNPLLCIIAVFTVLSSEPSVTFQLISLDNSRVTTLLKRWVWYSWCHMHHSRGNPSHLAEARRLM